MSSAPVRRQHWSAGSGTSRLAINQFQQQDLVDEAAVDGFLATHDVPIVEGRHCTFLFRGEADEVHLAQRILGLPSRLPMRRLSATTLWYIVLKVPEGSRINYQLEVRRGEHVERFNDPLNPKHSHSPFGASSVCFAHGYMTPDWTFPDQSVAPGELIELTVDSRALQRDCPVTIYLPARFRQDKSFSLLVVHDGGDFLQYSAAKVVLDNLIHRGEIADMVVAFRHPKDRLVGVLRVEVGIQRRLPHPDLPRQGMQREHLDPVLASQPPGRLDDRGDLGLPASRDLVDGQRDAPRSRAYQ